MLAVLFAGSFVAASAQIKMEKKVMVMPLKDSLMIMRFEKGTVGASLQSNKAAYDKLSEAQKIDVKRYLTTRLNLFSKTPSMPISPWMRCFFFPENCSSVTVNNFVGLHPCGIAISRGGKVAITTYEGDQADGSLLIWESYNDFKTGKTAKYEYKINDPEAVVFDNNEALYVADTYNGTIYYLKTIKDGPGRFYRVVGGSASYFVDASGNANSATNWNPRGLAVDASNNLYVMCENLQRSNLKSRIIKITNPTSASPTRTTMSGSDQSDNNAIGVAVYGNTLYATDLKSNQVKKYTINGNSLSLVKTLGDAGAALDVITDGTNVYFTNVAGGHSYAIKWNPNTNDTKNIDMGAQLPGDQITTSWGMAIWGNDILIADAIHKTIKIVDKNNAFH